MSRMPYPISDLLVPSSRVDIPDDYTRQTSVITSGLPHTIHLTQNLQLVLFLPNGVATFWKETAPEIIISASDNEYLPAVDGSATAVPDVYAPPLRLMLMDGAKLLASVPVAAEARYVLPHAGDADEAARIDLFVLDWVLASGTLRGPGDFGSRFSFAWRNADSARDSFSTPPIHPEVARRYRRYTTRSWNE